MQQVAVGGVDLDHFETGLQGTLGRGDKGVDHSLNLIVVQLVRRRVLRVEGDFRRAHRLPAALLELDAALLAQPWAIGAGLAPRVSQLDAGHAPLGGDETGDALQRGDLSVVPQAEVFSGDAAIGGHRHGFSDYQASTTHGAAA